MSPRKKKRQRPKAAKKVVVVKPMDFLKSVRIEKADNGFTISSFSNKGEHKRVAKNPTEAMKHAKDLLNE